MPETGVNTAIGRLKRLATRWRRLHLPKLHASTLRSLLVSHGLIDDTAARNGGTFDTGEGTRIVQPVLQAIPIVRLPRYINASRGQVRQLISTGILPQIDLKLSTQHKYGAQVLAPDADAFLAKLRDRARDVDDVPVKTLSVSAVGMSLDIPSPVILRLIEGGAGVIRLRVHEVSSTGRPRLSPVDVEMFAKTYVSLRRLSRETQIVLSV